MDIENDLIWSRMYAASCILIGVLKIYSDIMVDEGYRFYKMHGRGYFSFKFASVDTLESLTTQFSSVPTSITVDAVRDLHPSYCIKLFLDEMKEMKENIDTYDPERVCIGAISIPVRNDVQESYITSFKLVHSK